jgi:hypothetical protein
MSTPHVLDDADVFDDADILVAHGGGPVAGFDAAVGPRAGATPGGGPGSSQLQTTRYLSSPQNLAV